MKLGIWFFAGVLIRLVPASRREAFAGDLLEEYQLMTGRDGPLWASAWLLKELVRSAPHLIRWRLSKENAMSDSALVDEFQLARPSAGTVFRRTLSLFRSLYWRALILFLIIHFPLRIMVHFVISSEMVTNRVVRSLSANAVLLVSWTLTEGAILALMVQRRRAGTTSLRAAVCESLRRFPVFLVSRTVFLVVLAISSALFIVPGIVMGCLLMLHGWLIFDQGTGPFAALAGSYRLVHGRIRRTLRMSLPVAVVVLAWISIGIVFVAVSLRFASQHMPIFKIAPLTLTLVESGMLLFTILTGVLYVTYRAELVARSQQPIP